MKKNIAVFASGRGSNFEAIAKSVKRGALKVNLALLVCDNPGAPVLKKAKKYGVMIALVKREDYPTKEAFENIIIRRLEEEGIGLLVMAGFMRMLSGNFVSRYKNRILNIHPSLLPSFKGAHGIKDAFDYGAKVTGVTVHFVDEKMDHGAIILQEAVTIKGSDTEESLEAKIHKLEHRLYPEAVKLFVEDRLIIEGRKVRIIQ